MMITFWDKDDIPLTKCLLCRTTINGPSDTSTIEQLRSVILEKRSSKVSRGVLRLHDTAPIHKCNIVQAAVRQTGFIELNHPAYSPDIVPTDYHLFSNLKKFLRSKNFSFDDEAITTVVDYLPDLNSESFCKGIQSLQDGWQPGVASECQYLQ